MNDAMQENWQIIWFTAQSDNVCQDSFISLTNNMARQWVLFAHNSPKDAEYLLEFLNKGSFSQYLTIKLLYIFGTFYHIWNAVEASGNCL